MTSNAVVRHSPDTVAIDFFGNPMYVHVDDIGRVLGISGRATTMKVEIAAVDPASVDLTRLASDFAARDARGEGLGAPSPRAQVDANVGGARFTVTYSRPAKRGREIFGGLVPWEEVWRTGANEATHFTSDRSLLIGQTRVPAGTYTLWTVFTPETATLIINEQTGQWGTAYDHARDLVRIPMTRTALDEAVERFTIAIDSTADGGVLKLTWDTSQFSLPLRVVR